MNYDPVMVDKIVIDRQAESTGGIFSWILIICLVVGGIILAYTLFVKALRYFRGYDDKEFAEETVNELEDKTKKEEKPELPSGI